jgi:hypothetical protein
MPEYSLIMIGSEINISFRVLPFKVSTFCCAVITTTLVDALTRELSALLKVPVGI